MILLGVASLAGALLEAGFLVLITSVAMALVTDEQGVAPVLGIKLQIGQALAVGLVALITRLVLSIVVVQLAARLTARVSFDQRQRLSRAYLGTSWEIQHSEPSGRLQELLTTFVTKVTSSVTTMTNVVTATLSLVAFLLAALVVDALSTLAVVAGLVVVGLVLTPLRRWIRRRAQLSAAAGLDFANAVSEFGTLGQEMKTFGAIERFSLLIDTMSSATTTAQRKVQTLTGMLAPVYVTMAYSAVLGGIAALTLVARENLAVIGAVLLLMLRSLSYGQQLVTAAGTLASNTPFLERIDETVERYRQNAAPMGGATPATATPIEALDVDFAYDGKIFALADASFTIDRGEIIGVIGPSGAGKSTLAQLLLGLRPPTGGTIRVGDVDLRGVDRQWWSEQVASVAQEARLFTGTVAENIRFFRDGISQEAMEWAAEQANILADINALPERFDTHLGQRGGYLSGGQRQRLSIARALAGRPQVIVLDEPTSALDGASESLVRDTLGKLKGEVTVIIIAHRMSTLDICDRIMVVEAGH
ncbi:MAG: ABC transporter ATP-binding protein, partial [Propionibacteriaceae bacterium]|nr:ABC transporter ATP-binding protein [Propionibacteriaceae bacterium]